MKNLFKARWMTSLIFLIALFVITGIAAPGFLTYDNIVTCFNTATMYTLLAVGIAFVIMTGEIDVSIGATLGLTAGMTGLIAQQDGSIPKMLLLCLATGAAIGLVNGVGVSYFGVPSLIFTLGTNSVVRGLIYIMSGGRTIENFGGAISSYGNKTVFAGVTLYYAIAVVLVAISHLALTKTRKGKYFIAVGDNAGGANLVGISVLGTKILAYVLCGLFAGLGGFVFASKYGQVMTDLKTEEVEAFRNVIVMYADITTTGIYHIADFTAGGTGYFACGGKLIPIVWMCGGDKEPFRFFTESGEPLELGRGNTYMAICTPESLVVCEGMPEQPAETTGAAS